MPNNCLHPNCNLEAAPLELFCSPQCGTKFRAENPLACQQCHQKPLALNAHGLAQYDSPVCSQFCSILHKCTIPSGILTLDQLKEYDHPFSSRAQTLLAGGSLPTCLNCSIIPGPFLIFCCKPCQQQYLADHPDLCEQCYKKPKTEGRKCCSSDCNDCYRSGFPGGVTDANCAQYSAFLVQPMHFRGQALPHMTEKCLICTDVLSHGTMPSLVRLGCQCNGKVVLHENCLRSMIRANIRKCPVCSDEIADDNGNLLPGYQAMRLGIDHR